MPSGRGGRQVVQTTQSLASDAKWDPLVKDKEDTKDGTNDQVAFRTHKYASTPAPPPGLWDTDDVNYLDKVECKCCVRLINIDPKNGCFEGRLKFHWKVRTPHSKYDRTEPRIRVPGVRAPKLVSTVHESRIWREAVDDSSLTMCWKGTTDMSFYGWEVFEVQDFPFDRQLINMDLLEFVWRNDKDAATFPETMKLVSLDVVSLSQLPEWDTYPAIILAQEVPSGHSGPSHASRFVLRLRIQRKPAYYLTQIFLVAFLILLAALLPLALEPGEAHIGDRLSLHASGLLTLVAFKYGVQNDLPIVPYGTFTTYYLNAQIATVVGVSMESILSYRMNLSSSAADIRFWDLVENTLLLVLSGMWAALLVYCFFRKEPRPWESVIMGQKEIEEMTDGMDAGDHDSWGGLDVALDGISSENLRARTRDGAAEVWQE